MKARFLEKGLAGLSELSRKPGGNPNRTDEETICDIIRIKNSRPRWGAKKIYAVFCRLYPERKSNVSVPTVDRLLARSGLTKLSVWWLSLGISLDRIDPGKPSQNGGHERMHRDIRAELQGRIRGDLKLHQISFDQWRDDFNNECPHEALDMRTPSELYVPSANAYVGDVVPTYPAEYIVRMVNDRGYTNYKGHRIFIGNSFNGYEIGLRFIAGISMEVYFGSLLLGHIDRNNYLFTPNQEEATAKTEAELAEA